MSDKRIDIFKILEDEGKLTKVLVYPAVEVVQDPYEKNVTNSYLNYTTIKGLVREISPESLRWKYTGLIPIKSKELICQKKWKNTLLIADKIKIGDDYYKTYKQDKSFAISEKDEYLIVILEYQINA